MANEFIARKGLIALENSQVTGSLNISGSITANNLSGTNTGDQDLSSLATKVQLNTSSSTLQSNIDTKASIAQLNTSSSELRADLVANSATASFVTNSQTSSFSTATGVEDNADVTDTANVTSAGALMDSELAEIATVKALTAAGITGSFNAASASFSTRVTANDAKLTANTSNVTSAGALMDSELAEIATVKALTKAGISGSFTAASASFSTRVTANDAKLTANTSNVTSAGALMDSEVTNLSFVKGLTGGISDGNVLTANNAVSDDDFLRINGTEVEGLTAAEVRTALNVENGADVTDTSNVTSAGALMDSELSEIATVKALTAAGISGSFTAASASLAADIVTNAGNIGTTTNALTVDNATLQLNSGTTFNGSAARTISIKDGGVDSDALAANISVTQITASAAEITTNKLSKTSNTDADHQGDVVFFGGTTSMTAGRIYHYNSSGNWELSNATDNTKSTGLLAVALGTASDTDGMLLKGMVTLDHDPGAVGDKLFLRTADGLANAIVASSTGNVIRVIGYCLDASNGQIYFNPSNDHIVHA